MKVKNIILGILIIAFAIFGILEVSGVFPPLGSIIGELSFFRLISALLIVIAFFNVGLYGSIFLLSFLFMVLEPNIAFMLGLENSNIINNWYLLLFTALICIGLRLIIPKKHKFKNYGDKMHISEHSKLNKSNEHNFTSATEYIDCSSFTSKRFENNFGQLNIHFENISEYVGEGRVYIENNFGKTVIHVPNGWRIITEVENNCGVVKNDHTANTTGPVLYICGENNFGRLEIKIV